MTRGDAWHASSLVTLVSLTSLASLGACRSSSNPGPAATQRAAVASMEADVITTADVPRPDPIARGVPHASPIRAIAVTEPGDAAISIDESNDLRLWPALDGSRPPVPVSSASPPSQLALVRDGRELVAVLTDATGGVELVRLGLDGSVRARASLASESPIEEVVVTPTGLVARTSDHALAQFGLDGAARGRLVAAPGERILDIAARSGRIAAVIQTERAHDLQWIGADGALRWESRRPLPSAPTPGTLSISPGARVVAYATLATEREAPAPQVLDAETLLPVDGTGPVSVPGVEMTGFIDDDTVGFASTTVTWWQRARPAEPATTASVDPWHVASSPPLMRNISLMRATPGFATGRVVTAHDSSLALNEHSVTRYLGYAYGSDPRIRPVGDVMAMRLDARQLGWLDENLAIVRSVLLRELTADADARLEAEALGPRHVLLHAYSPRNERTTMTVIDLEHRDRPIHLGDYADVRRYEGDRDFVTLVADRKLRRFALDLTAGTAVEQSPSISVGDETISWAAAFDPARAGGIVAVASQWLPSGEQVLAAWRLQDGTLVRSVRRGFNGTVVRSDPDGTIYVALRRENGLELTILHGTDDQAVIPRRVDQPLGVSADGTLFVGRDGHDLVGFGVDGGERWRATVWDPSAVEFLSSRRLVVAARGGVVVLDATTGSRVARECGWSFGLHDDEPASSSFAAGSVCEDPILP